MIVSLKTMEDARDLRDVFTSYWSRPSDFKAAEENEADFSASLEAHNNIIKKFSDYVLTEIYSYITGKRN